MTWKIVPLGKGEQQYCCLTCDDMGIETDPVALLVERARDQSIVVTSGLCANHAKALGFDGGCSQGTGPDSTCRKEY